MPVYKINYVFKARLWGWTETYYAEYENIRACLTSARELMNFRRHLLGGVNLNKEPRIDSIRVSDIARQRDALVLKIGEFDGYNNNPISPADRPTTCMLVRMESTADYQRTLYLRGQPDTLVQDMIKVDNPFWDAGLQIYGDSLIARRWGILAVTKPDNPTVITSILQLDPNVVTVETALPHGLVAGDEVRVLSTPGIVGLRGNRWVLAAPNATQLRIVSIITGVYRGGGKLYKRTPALKPFTSVQCNSAGTRSTGRPSDGPVGRRRRRRVA